MMLLDEVDLRIIEANQLVIGFDDDDPDKHQFVHICRPYRCGPLCGSKRLWFTERFSSPPTEEETSRIDCVECVKKLRQYQL